LFAVLLPQHYDTSPSTARQHIARWTRPGIHQ